MNERANHLGDEAQLDGNLASHDQIRKIGEPVFTPCFYVFTLFYACGSISGCLKSVSFPWKPEAEAASRALAYFNKNSGATLNAKCTCASMGLTKQVKMETL